MKNAVILLILTISLCWCQKVDITKFSKIFTVEIEGQVYGSYVDWSKAFGGSGGVATIGASTTRTWRGYQGGLPISESNFYDLAGLNDIAKRAYEYRKSSVSMFTIGTIGAIAGLCLMVLGATQNQVNEPLCYTGLTISIVGLPFMYIGGFRMNKRMTPASFALQVAEEYNNSIK
jgi:hypothetical protein